MPRPKRKQEQPEPQPAPQPSEPTPPPASTDTSVGASNYEESDGDATAPMNPRVRLKQVVAFKLFVIVTGASGERRFDSLQGPGVHERMTEKEVFDLNGPGTYRAVWYRYEKRMSGSNGVSICGVHEFTIHAPINVTPQSQQQQSAVVVQAPPGKPNAISDTQRIVPDGFDSVHQWVFSQLDTARMDREEIMMRLDKAFDTIVALSTRNGEMATQNAALAASIVSTMHEANKRDIDSRLGMAREVVDMRNAMLQMQGSGGMEKIVAQYAARIADRFIPPTNAKPDQIASTLDKVDKTLPRLDSVAAELPAIKAQMGELQSFLREARPMLKKLSAMTGGDETPQEPAQDTAQETAPGEPLPDSVDV